jgi:hypothetical protein
MMKITKGRLREIISKELQILIEASITIDKVNYFPELGSYNNDYNAKVLYQKSGKLYLAHIFIDFFNKKIFISKQPKEGKVLAGLEAVVNDYARKVNWYF